MTNEPAYAGSSAAAIQRHYDRGQEFYKLWLGQPLLYSAGLWSGGEEDTLDDAQLRSLDWAIEHAAAAGAEHVLDIGCGWGRMLERLIERGAGRATGLTLSEDQAGHVAAAASPGVEARLEHYADHTPGDRYDAIVCIEAFEHLADIDMSRDEKVDAYREFFSRCRRWLKPGGRIALQAIAKGNSRMDRQALEDGRFIYEKIFPETDSPRLAELLQSSENKFEPRVLRLDPGHYERTLAEWARRLEGHRAEATQLVGETTVAMYERYFRAGRQYFDRGHATLVRVAFERV